MDINWSMMNVSDIGGYSPMESMKYVTIESCKAYIAQTQFWMFMLGFLFLFSWTFACYYLYKYLKEKKRNRQQNL